MLPALEYGCVVWAGSHRRAALQSATPGLLHGNISFSWHSHECYGAVGEASPPEDRQMGGGGGGGAECISLAVAGVFLIQQSVHLINEV